MLRNASLGCLLEVVVAMGFIAVSDPDPRILRYYCAEYDYIPGECWDFAPTQPPIAPGVIEDPQSQVLDPERAPYCDTFTVDPDCYWRHQSPSHADE